MVLLEWHLSPRDASFEMSIVPPLPDRRAHLIGGFGSQGPADVGPAGTEGLAVQRLQRKLKEAARKILHLRLEKEQLVELGNRLRAELGRPVGEPARVPARDAMPWGMEGTAAKVQGEEGGRENTGALWREAGSGVGVVRPSLGREFVNLLAGSTAEKTRRRGRGRRPMCAMSSKGCRAPRLAVAARISTATSAGAAGRRCPGCLPQRGWCRGRRRHSKTDAHTFPFCGHC